VGLLLNLVRTPPIAVRNREPTPCLSLLKNRLHTRVGLRGCRRPQQLLAGVVERGHVLAQGLTKSDGDFLLGKPGTPPPTRGGEQNDDDNAW
jgi:hypothetical protein